MTSVPSGIRDNRHRGTVADFLKSHIKPDAKLAIVSAYFTIYAYEALRDKLDAIDTLHFLFGEPQFISNLDPERNEQKQFQIEDDALQLHNQLQQKRIAKDCYDWLKQKAEIRSVKSAGLLHGKLYHIDNEGKVDAILGSSNFTTSGLGLRAKKNNIELNMVVDSRRDLDDLRVWFDELWNNEALVSDVKEDVLRYLSQIYTNHSPEFIYFKTLFHLFESYLDEQRRNDLLTQQSQITSTRIWNALFEFQRDGVKGAIARILKHNGCIIADSVGLGKTYEALAVIKYFELRNDKVLVLCPKKLRQNWTIYQASNNSSLNPFSEDRFSYTVLSHTDLSRERGTTGDIDLAQINWGNYDLVVIDESHNFRNNTKGRKDADGNRIARTRYERLMEDIIQSGVNTKVLLLSATPVNNDLSDLRNQLAFLTGGRDNAFHESLNIPNLKDLLAQVQRRFKEWVERGAHSNSLLNTLDSRFFTLLDALTIARSRKHIERYYGATIAQLGGFPTRQHPISLSGPIDSMDLFDSYDQINEEILRYKLSLYTPSSYVLPAYQTKYQFDRVQNFSQAQREKYLIAMMKVNFLKRLESSVEAFELTMLRTLEKIEELEQKIKIFKQQPSPKQTVSTDDGTMSELDSEDETLQEAQMVGKGLRFQLAHLDLDRWLKDLGEDKRQINRLLLQARQVTPERDWKLEKLKELIRQKVLNPSETKDDRVNRKVLVFTAFADTARYLYDCLQSWARQDLGIEVGLVGGTASMNRSSYGSAEFNHILTNFSPRSKRRAQIANMRHDKEIDLLIATDCISEGQNLQDCDLVINYDIHWNPVRIIQRFGRIDRIGSLNRTVQMVNFWPTPDLNKYINLRNRVEARMALVDLTATGADNVLADPNNNDDLADYRDKQLLRLQNEILDLEDFDETISLTDFSLDDFRVDLSKYLEQQHERLRKEPIGLYAVVDHSWAGSEHVKPGVIFCLRQRASDTSRERINPLDPFYLVYIGDDTSVRAGFSSPKQTLEIFRALSLGKTKADDALCNWFDQQTKDGSDMSQYSDLLAAAIKDIEQRFRQRSVSQLQHSRSALLPTSAPSSDQAQQFELITWLVIR
jgi:SNF2 family DNA or RNA helicase